MATHRDDTAAPDGAARVTRPGDTVEEAYVRLRDLIVEGVYLPGQRLPQAQLWRCCASAARRCATRSAACRTTAS